MHSGNLHSPIYSTYYLLVFSCSNVSVVGFKPGYIPQMMANDTIDVFVLKAPVWEFKFGDLLKHFVSDLISIAFFHE